MTSGKGLGKGLSALFGEEMEKEQVRGIPILEIEPNPDQPRREFDPESMAELEDSIRRNGVITPISVRKAEKGYTIIAGERRWRAARAAGLSEIPAYVMEVESDRDAYRLALIENLQREDLNPINEAMGYQKLIEDYGMSQEQAGETVGRSRSYISNSLRLLSLPESIQAIVAMGAISAGHGRALVVLDEQKASEATRMIIEQELSVRETESLVKRMLKNDEEGQKQEDPALLYVKELENSLSSKTGHRIMIKHGKKKGRITIEYYGNDDLDVICRALDNITTIKGE